MPEFFRISVHAFMHVLAPILIARFFFADNWKRTSLIFLSTMLVDLDHLWADPVFDPQRNSLGFHPLHSMPFLAVYPVMLLPAFTRKVGLGLCLHMFTDALDAWLR